MNMNKKQKNLLVRIIVAAVLAAVINKLIPIDNRFILGALNLVPYLVIGYQTLKKAFKGIVKKQIFDENFLMAIATVGAYALGDYSEAVAVMVFYQVGELFESYAVGKSRRNISNLMDIRPDYANVEIDGELVKKEPDEIEIGTVIKVLPGEKIPIDGIVIEGSGSLDTSALTGESVPRDVNALDEVVSGCINLSSVLSIKTTKEFGESTASKILELVENASSRKSKSENFISKFSRVYTPTVCICALGLALIPPIISLIIGNDGNFGEWIYRALSFLVISCPCALVISIPLSFFGGIGGAGREGVLVKGSNYLEALSSIKYVVFDKTGTLTKGVFEVTSIVPSKDSISRDELLQSAAGAEVYSSHPIASSLVKACKETPKQEDTTEVNEISGQGLSAFVKGKKVHAGNLKLMNSLGLEVPVPDETGTIVYVAIEGEYAGYIVINDVLKDGSKEAMKALKHADVKKTVMLTGDAKKVAEKVSRELFIDDYRAELLPSDKVDAVEKLLLEKGEKETLAFVGDGINDAPVLARADIGIAMGAMGTDAAIEAADVVLMDDDPRKIAKAIRIARKCMRIVYENIWLAIGIKVICLVATALGFANMWLAIFADVGVMILAVLNAIRALNVKRV